MKTPSKAVTTFYASEKVANICCNLAGNNRLWQSEIMWQHIKEEHHASLTPISCFRTMFRGVSNTLHWDSTSKKRQNKTHKKKISLTNYRLMTIMLTKN